MQTSSISQEVQKPDLYPLPHRQHEIVKHLTSVLGNKDYHKEIHFSGSFIEIWRMTKVGSFESLKISYTDLTRSGHASNTYSTLWHIQDKFYVVTYGYNGKEENSINDPSLQKTHTELFNMLLLDVKHYFFANFVAKHPRKSK